jgi:AcrR family transcriptional regulator
VAFWPSILSERTFVLKASMVSEAPPTTSEGTRPRIRQAALELFLQHGYHATSMRQIARRARVSLAAIYNHIPSKEELFIDLLSELIPHRGMVAAMSQATGETVEDLVQDATRRMGLALAQSQDNMRLMFIELLEFQGRHAPFLAEEFLPGGMGFISRLQRAEGRLKPYPPMILARAFFGLVVSYAVTVSFFKEIPQLAFGAEDLSAFGDIYLHGILEAETPAAARPATG